VASKTYKPEELMCALYEILNYSRLFEKHPNIADLRAIDYVLSPKPETVLNVTLLFNLIDG
jgi:hypothetical protein